MQLHFYNQFFKNAIEQYQLTSEQLYYTGKPQDCIKLSCKNIDRFSILGVECNMLVTFFNLHKNEGVKPYSNNLNSILLRAFSTDFRYQGRGFAKKALKQLPNFVSENFNEINEIVLAVNLKNIAAQSLYLKSGFVDAGTRLMGKKGEQIVMSYYL